jgi:serine/threonine-protein phosphatase 2A regulatory subunit B'
MKNALKKLGKHLTGKNEKGKRTNGTIDGSKTLKPRRNSGEETTITATLTEVKRVPETYSRAELLKPIKNFTEATDAVSLFLHKLRLCSILFDWHGQDSQDDAKAKDIKRQQLLELVEYIGKNKEVWVPEVLEATVDMVAANLFRSLPPKQHEGIASSPTEPKAAESDEEDPVFEPSWPHLQIVYEFFLRFIVSSDIDIKTLKRYINGVFVLRILELFDSEDHRERDYLKTILHRIYAKFMSLRAFIRKAINNVFFVFIYETQRHNGIAELLEILGSIINGFALPLKAEHRSFLQNVLVPMHKVRALASFHPQLSYCVTQFVDKDPTLAVPVLQGLLKYWPVTNSAKEMLFLNELEELLELTQQEEFKQILAPLFRQLSRAIGSPHFQVAERALFLWHNDYISGLIADNRRDILPIIYPVLHVNSESHWNLTVKNLTYNVLKIFMELDTPLVEQCSKAYVAKKGKDEIRIQQKLEYWTKLGADIKDKSAWLLAADKKPAPRERETKFRDPSDLSSSSSSSVTSSPNSSAIDHLTTSFSSLSVPDDTETSDGPSSPPSTSVSDGGAYPETPTNNSTEGGATGESKDTGSSGSSGSPTETTKDSHSSAGLGGSTSTGASSPVGDTPQAVLAS